jgi:hypothetical protein
MGQDSRLGVSAILSNLIGITIFTKDDRSPNKKTVVSD